MMLHISEFSFTDMVFVFVLSLVSFLIGYFFAKQYYSAKNNVIENEEKNHQEKEYLDSNFGKPGVIKAIKTRERSGKKVEEEDYSLHQQVS